MFETEDGDIYDISGFTPEERNYFFTQNPTAKELQDYSGVSFMNLNKALRQMSTIEMVELRFTVQKTT